MLLLVFILFIDIFVRLSAIIVLLNKDFRESC